MKFMYDLQNTQQIGNFAIPIPDGVFLYRLGEF